MGGKRANRICVACTNRFENYSGARTLYYCQHGTCSKCPAEIECPKCRSPQRGNITRKLVTSEQGEFARSGLLFAPRKGGRYYMFSGAARCPECPKTVFHQVMPYARHRAEEHRIPVWADFVNHCVEMTAMAETEQKEEDKEVVEEDRK